MRKRMIAALSTILGLLLLLTGCEGNGFQLGNGQSDKPSAPTVSVLDTSHIQKDWADRKIKPTAIILHWWGYENGSNIDTFAKSLHGVRTKFDPRANSKAQAEEMARAGTSGRLAVQVAVGKNGVAYQLTPTLDTFARHAKCANQWAVGVEIEGDGPSIINNKAQRAKVIAVVKELQAKFDIPTKGVVAADGKSGSGVLSHKQVDVEGCRWPNGDTMAEGKPDVDDNYLDYVLAHLG